jgi:phosphoribosylaminoimidazole-succinocarboxamide synthase
MGSVKDLIIIEKPTAERSGRGRFVFSDRYSVFDWGEMPDHIDGKGAALCLVSAWYFEQLEARGWKTHYRGLVSGTSVMSLDTVTGPVDTMEVSLYRVISPLRTENGYDYAPLAGVKANVLVPLEVIYRFSLPPGSSVFKRLASGQASPEDFGLDHMPTPGETLPAPILDFSTKLEETDRYLTRDEARALSGLTDERFEELCAKSLALAELIRETMAKHGITNEDGKFEFALDETGNIVLVDAVGTPDECRFTVRGLPFSKELARSYYRKTAWYREVEEAKARDFLNWKTLVDARPEPLPGDLKQVISWIYQSLANELVGRRIFDGVPALSEVLDSLEAIRATYDLE